MLETSPIAVENKYDEPVQMLGRRYPLLLADISQWVQANPAAMKVKAVARQPRVIRQGSSALLYNCLDPRSILGHLQSDEHPPQQCIHLFPDVSDFLHFLTRPAADECLLHDKWLPV